MRWGSDLGWLRVFVQSYETCSQAPKPDLPLDAARKSFRLEVQASWQGFTPCKEKQGKRDGVTTLPAREVR